MGTLKPQRNDRYTAIRWLVHWPLIGGLLHLVQRGGARGCCGPAQSPPRCTKCNSPPINGHGQCTNLYYSMWHYNCLCTLKSKLQWRTSSPAAVYPHSLVFGRSPGVATPYVFAPFFQLLWFWTVWCRFLTILFRSNNTEIIAGYRRYFQFNLSSELIAKKLNSK